MYDATQGRFLQRDPVGLAIGEVNLYEFVAGAPALGADPSGLSPVIRPGIYLKSGEEVGSNKYGTFYMDAKHVAIAVGDQLEARIYFKPKKSVCCNEIAFLQAVRTIDTAKNAPIRRAGVAPMDEEGWHLDNGPGRRYGWYGYGSPWLGALGLYGALPSTTLLGSIGMGLYTISGVPFSLEVWPLYRGQVGMAYLGDGPVLFNASERQEFITCAVCRSGKDAGTIYGCIQWSHEVDAKGVYTQHRTQFVNAPDKGFWSAIGAWNANAEENKEDENGRFPVRVPEPIPPPTMK
jgi:hypothetical protein